MACGEQQSSKAEIGEGCLARGIARNWMGENVTDLFCVCVCVCV